MTGQHRTGERDGAQDMDDRRVVARHPVREAHIARAALLRGLHEAGDAGEQRSVARRFRLDLDRPREVHDTGMHDRACKRRYRLGFTRDQACIEIARAAPDNSVDRDALTRRDGDDVACTQVLDGDLAASAIGIHQRGAVGLQGKEIGGRLLRAAPHDRVEVTADQQEEQKRGRAVEIDLLGTADRLEQAHRRRQKDGERDRHIHVESARPQSRERRAVEGPPREGDDRQRDQGRDPVEQGLRRDIHVAGLAPPHRDGQHHDVGGGETRDAETQKQAALVLAVDGRRIAERMSRETGALEPVEHGLPIEHVLAPAHRHALRGEVGAREHDAGGLRQRALDRRNAAAAAHAGDRECEFRERMRIRISDVKSVRRVAVQRCDARAHGRGPTQRRSVSV